MQYEQLVHRISEIRLRLRRTLWLYGLSWVAAVVLSAMLGAAALDWLLHLDDSGVRLILALSIIATGAWVCWRRLARPLLTPLSDVDIAMRIESRYPQFNDSLASTIEFASRQSDPRLGSPALQRDVIHTTLQQIECVDVSDLVETRSARRVAAVALTVITLVAVVFSVKRAEAAIAFKRLVMPFSASAWPNTTQLQLLDSELQPLSAGLKRPLRVAHGETLELYVENQNGELPDEVRLEYLVDGEVVTSEHLRRTTLRDDEGQAHEVCAVTLAAIETSMRFRAVGGDDYDMPFYQLEVVSPPALSELQVHLTPPAYTARSPESLPPGVGHVSGLLGTRVDIRAVASKPLKSASLQIGGESLPIDTIRGGTHFRTFFVIDEPGVSTYALDLIDQEGFQHPHPPRYEVRGVADAVPDVFIEVPDGDMQVTADAEVSLRIIARDDLGLADVRLHYHLGDDEEHATVTSLSSDGESPEQLEFERQWDLSKLQLSHGTRIVFHAEAVDRYDLGPEHVGQSMSRSLTVVSPAEKAVELAQRQAALLDELERAFDSQDRAHKQLADLGTQIDAAGHLQPQDLDLLKRVELDQRRIASQILNPVDGIERRTQELLNEFRQNGIDQPEMQQQLERIADELALLHQDQLPAIESRLTQALKHAQADASDTSAGGRQQKAAATAIDEAASRQEQVLAVLEDLIGTLSRWRSLQDVDRELDRLIAEQEELNRRTAEIGRQTLTKSSAELTDQERADLARTANRQRGNAGELQELQAQIAEQTEKLAETAPAEASALSAALEHLNEQAVANRLREVAQDIEQNNVGQAAREQQQALEELRAALDILGNREESDLEALVSKLEQSQNQLEAIRQQQAELMQETADEPPSDARARQIEQQQLREQQQQLQQELNKTSRELRRLRARQAAETSGRAAEVMQAAEEQLSQADGGAAAQHQQQSLDELEQAQREVANARRQAEAELARELLARIADEIAGMIERQQTVIDGTLRLETERATRGNWSRAQLKTLKDVADSERQLSQETERLAASLQAAEVFALAVQGAARDMQRAAQRLVERQTDELTVQAEQAAKERFVDLLAALEADQSEAARDNEQQAAQQPPDSQSQDESAIPQLAQLKMLKKLQQDLIERTSRLHVLRQEAPELSDDLRAELDVLAAEQGQLAELTQNLIQRAQGSSSDENDAAPQPEIEEQP